MSERLNEQIERSFEYHPPGGNQVERYKKIREAARELAHLIANNSPESREQSLAITSLEQTVMWANAAIARNEHPVG